MAERIEQATAAPGEVRRVYVRATSLSSPSAGWYEIVSDDGTNLVLRRVQ